MCTTPHHVIPQGYRSIRIDLKKKKKPIKDKTECIVDHFSNTKKIQNVTHDEKHRAKYPASSIFLFYKCGGCWGGILP